MFKGHFADSRPVRTVVDRRRLDQPPLQGKKPAEPLRERGRGFGRRLGVISPLEVTWDASVERTTEMTMVSASPLHKDTARAVGQMLARAKRERRRAEANASSRRGIDSAAGANRSRNAV